CTDPQRATFPPPGWGVPPARTGGRRQGPGEGSPNHLVPAAHRLGFSRGAPAAGGYNQGLPLRPARAGRHPPFLLPNGRVSMTRMFAVAAALGVLAAAVPAAPPDKFTFVDLKPYANQKLTDNFGSGREGNDLKAVRTGLRTFAEVNFQI